MMSNQHTIWGYGRVSDGGKQVSLIRQKECVEFWLSSGMRDHKFPAVHAEDQYGYSPRENWFEDLNVSGYSKKILERPAMQSIINRVRPGDVIIVSHLDRITRDVADMLQFSKMMREVNVYIFMIDLQIDTSTSEGTLILTQLAAIAQYERDRLMNRTMAGKARLKADGCLVNGLNPAIGWRKHRAFDKKFGKKVTRCKPDHKRREHAMRMMAMRDSGMTFPEIEAQLWAEGVLLPKSAAKGLGGYDKPGKNVYRDPNRRLQYTQRRIQMHIDSARAGFPEFPPKKEKKAKEKKSDVSIYDLLSPASRASLPPALLVQSELLG